MGTTRVGITAVHERVDNGHDYRKEVDQKSSLSAQVAVRREVIQTCVRLTRRGTTANSRPKTMAAARLVPKHHGSLGINDVEDQSSDKKQPSGIGLRRP